MGRYSLPKPFRKNHVLHRWVKEPVLINEVTLQDGPREEGACPADQGAGEGAMGWRLSRFRAIIVSVFPEKNPQAHRPPASLCPPIL